MQRNYFFFFLSFFLGFCFVHRSWCSRLSPRSVCFDCCLPTRNREPKRLGRNGQRSNCIERNGNRSSRAQRKTFSSDWKDRAWMICRTWTRRQSVFFDSKEEKQHTVKGKITEKQQQQNNNNNNKTCERPGVENFLMMTLKESTPSCIRVYNNTESQLSGKKTRDWLHSP